MRANRIKAQIILAGFVVLCICFTEIQLNNGIKVFTTTNNYRQNGEKRNNRNQPHILFIIADDLGFNDVGYHGSDIKTPNLDRLAKSGVRLENYYVQPTCTPTRGQLLTGRYQIHTGLHWVLHPATPSGLALDHTTLADKLREAGYATHMVGKWHLGFFQPEYLPTRRGFDSFFGFLTGHSDYFTHVTNQYGKYFMSGYDLMENENPANITKYNGSYSTNLFANKVIDLIQHNDFDKPLFIYVSFQAVHGPLQVPEHYVKLNSHITDPNRRTYAGMVSSMDNAIGNICEAMKQWAYFENTVLIFTTDNGGNPKAGGSNLPLRGGKGSLWEGGIRAVGFVHSALLLNQENGYVSKELMHITDWFPTLVNLAGGNLAISKDLDGYDQWKTIKYKFPSPRKELLHNIDPQVMEANKSLVDKFNSTRKASLRVGNMKIVIRYEGQALHSRNSSLKYTRNIRLFNIDKDPLEKIDLSGQLPGTVKYLLQRLENYKLSMVSCINPDIDPQADPKYQSGFWQPWVFKNIT